MMKAKHIMKVLALAIALASASPLLNAQGDGFFGSYSEGSRNGDDNGSNNCGVEATNQTFGESAPLGGGLAILVASAAGYALLKRRKQQDSLTTKKHVR